jgi:hypothetical protein
MEFLGQERGRLEHATSEGAVGRNFSCGYNVKT